MEEFMEKAYEKLSDPYPKEKSINKETFDPHTPQSAITQQDDIKEEVEEKKAPIRKHNRRDYTGLCL